MNVDWRRRETWTAVGYALTAAWMLFVLWRTGGDVSHPLFQHIFIVPLVGWIVVLVLARIVRALRGDR